MLQSIELGEEEIAFNREMENLVGSKQGVDQHEADHLQVMVIRHNLLGELGPFALVATTLASSLVPPSTSGMFRATAQGKPSL